MAAPGPEAGKAGRRPRTEAPEKAAVLPLGLYLRMKGFKALPLIGI